jgi:hypothetical protein
VSCHDCAEEYNRGKASTTFPAQALRDDLDPRSLLVGVGLAAVALLVTHRFWNYALATLGKMDPSRGISS